MTSDQMDSLAERLAFQAVEIAGIDDAPGVLIQALLLAMQDHHSLDAALFCLESTVERLRVDVAQQVVVDRTVQ